MEAILKDGQAVMIRMLNKDDTGRLHTYFHQLSRETKMRFGPHSFGWHTVVNLCNTANSDTVCVIAEAALHKEIIAYAVIRTGFLEHDAERLKGWGLKLNADTDCSFAPSVSDAWQHSGLGSKLLEFITAYLLFKRFRRIILWGGVQCSNEKAVNFYRKHGFETVGTFEYNGMNFDMVKNIV